MKTSFSVLVQKTTEFFGGGAQIGIIDFGDGAADGFAFFFRDGRAFRNAGKAENGCGALRDPQLGDGAITEITVQPFKYFGGAGRQFNGIGARYRFDVQDGVFPLTFRKNQLYGIDAL